MSAEDLVRRTGLKPGPVLSLVMAGAFDGITPNRREALCALGAAPPTRTERPDGPAHVNGGQRAPALGFHEEMGADSC